MAHFDKSKDGWFVFHMPKQTAAWAWHPEPKVVFGHGAGVNLFAEQDTRIERPLGAGTPRHGSAFETVYTQTPRA